MVDATPLYPIKFHPASGHMRADHKAFIRPFFTRTSRPTKYYIIDFGLSRQYAANNASPQEMPIYGGDRTAPEFRNPCEPYDPFPTDIYYIGNLMRESFLNVRTCLYPQSIRTLQGLLSPTQKTRNFEFLRALVTEMVDDDPTKRPKIDEVVSRFNELVQALSWRTLRSRVVNNDETTSQRVLRSIGHTFKTMGYILTMRPAIPSPRR